MTALFGYLNPSLLFEPIPTLRHTKQDTMPHVLFHTHVAVRELDLSEITSLESDPEHRPKASLNYTPIPDDDFLRLLTVAFNNHLLAPSMMLELSKKRLCRIGTLTNFN